MHPTPTDYLPILAGIQPAELYGLEATLFSGILQSDGARTLTSSVSRRAHYCPRRETTILKPLCACNTNVAQ